MVYVVLAHDWTSIVLHPDAGQRISTDLVVLVRTLCVIRYVQTNVLAITDVAVLDQWICTATTHTNGGTNCRKKTPTGTRLLEKPLQIKRRIKSGLLRALPMLLTDRRTPNDAMIDRRATVFAHLQAVVFMMRYGRRNVR